MSRGAMTFEKSVLAQARLHQLIPGGAHTYARGSDQFPEDMTPVLVRGRGARVQDLDGNWLIEYGMGLRSSHARSRLPAGGGCGPHCGSRRRQLFAAEHLGAACRRGLLGADPGRGHGEVRQEWLGCHHGGDQARAGGNGP